MATKSLQEYLQSSGVAKSMKDYNYVLSYDPSYGTMVNSKINDIYNNISNASDLSDSEKDQALQNAFQSLSSTIKYSAGSSSTQFGNLFSQASSQILSSTLDTVRQAKASTEAKQYGIDPSGKTTAQLQSEIASKKASGTQANAANDPYTNKPATIYATNPDGTVDTSKTFSNQADATAYQQQKATQQNTSTNGTVSAQSLPPSNTDNSNSSNATGLNGQAPSEQVRSYAEQHGMSLDQAFNILQSSGQLQGNGTGTTQAPLTTQQQMENQAATGQSGTFTATAQGKNTLKAYNNITGQWGYVEPGVYVKGVSLQPNPTSTNTDTTGTTGTTGTDTTNNFKNGTTAEEIANTNANFNYGTNGATVGTNGATATGGIDYTDIDKGIDADTSLTDSQKTMLKAFARQHTGGFDQKSIIDTFDKLKKSSIDPIYDQQISATKTNITNQFNVLNANRERELENQRLTYGNNIRQAKTDLEARGMTNSGEDIKTLGAAAAYGQGGQNGGIPGQSAIGANEDIGVNAGLTTTTPFGDDRRFYEGTVNQQNRLLSSATATAYQNAQQQLGQAAENALGTTDTGSLGIAYNPAGGQIGSIELNKRYAENTALNNVIGAQSTANENIDKTMQNYNFTY